MAKPLLMRMNDATALQLVRDIAKDSGKVIFTDHALRRMRQRKVTAGQVMACLQLGIISEPVALDPHGNWKLTLSRRVAGANLSVAVAIDLLSRAIIITVF